MLADAREDLTAFAAFPSPTDQALVNQPAERVNKEVKRRTNAVGISPTTLPCCGWPAVLIEAHDEWQVAEPLPVRRLDGQAHSRPAMMPPDPRR